MRDTSTDNYTYSNGVNFVEQIKKAYADIDIPLISSDDLPTLDFRIQGRTIQAKPSDKLDSEYRDIVNIPNTSEVHLTSITSSAVGNEIDLTLHFSDGASQVVSFTIPESRGRTDEDIIDGIEAQTGDDRLDYDALKNTPTIPTPVQSDWGETDSNDISFILNKPNIVSPVQPNWDETNSNALSFILNKPTIPTPVQSDWSETDSNDPSFIQNKPTIPSAQVQADWNETDNNDPSFILNKISLMAGNNVNVVFDTNTNTYTISSTGGGGTMTLSAEEVRDLLAGLTGSARLSATSIRDIPQANWVEVDSSDPSYILNKPDITEPVQSNWNETDQSDLSYILNKPDITEPVQPNWDETDQSDLSYILNKPTIPTLVQSDWDETDTSDPSFIQNKPTIPSAQVQSDWNETDEDDPSFILNKISVVAGDNVSVAFDTNNNEYTISASGGTTPPAPDTHTIYYGGLNSSETLTDPLTQLNTRADTEEGTSYNIDVDGTTLNDGWYGVIVLPDGETLSILETHGFNQLNQWTLSSETYNGITYNVYRADNNRGGISYNLDFTIAEG